MSCPHCGCDEIDWIDEGIGKYEYWGSKGVDVDMVPVCSECGEYAESSETYSQWLRNRQWEYEYDSHEYD